MFGTPQLLMLSGIGPKAELSQLNIPVVLDSPNVGKNLADHPLLAIYYEVNSNSSFDPVLRSESTMIPPLLQQWESNRTGLLVVPVGGNTAAFLKNPPGFLSGQDPSSGPLSGNIEMIFCVCAILPSFIHKADFFEERIRAPGANPIPAYWPVYDSTGCCSVSNFS